MRKITTKFKIQFQPRIKINEKLKYLVKQVFRKHLEFRLKNGIIIRIPKQYEIDNVMYSNNEANGINAGGLSRQFYDEVGKEFVSDLAEKMVLIRDYFKNLSPGG